VEKVLLLVMKKHLENLQRARFAHAKLRKDDTMETKEEVIAQIKIMLEDARKRLEERQSVNDHAECIRLQGWIGALEHLWILYQGSKR